MTGQAKIELILELKNRLKSGLAEAKAKVSKDVGEMKLKLAELRTSFRDNFKSMADEIPGLSTGLRLLKNPLALAGAAVFALGKGIASATEKAADFQTAFRSLQNLNLDKSRAELNRLRSEILDVAFKNGFDAQKTANAYNEVQSTTGKYGSEVRKIVEKQGNFANLMQADFDKYVASTAAAMINFGFGADRLDDFNRSAYATMNVGKVSFDEIARVQSVYAGSAKSAMQDFEAANKMFSLFTISSKSVDTAATQTRSLFNDLTRPSTLAAFKKIGINVYEAGGQFKQVDKLLLELNKKFNALGKDKQVIALKNQFSGSLGLTAMVQAATDKTGQLQESLKEFENSKVNLDVAVDFAKNDFNYIKDQMQNKANTLAIELADAWMPFANKLKQLAVDALGWINWNVAKNQKQRQNTVYTEGVTAARDKFPEVDNIASMNQAQMQEFMGKVIAERNNAKEYLLKSEAKRDKVTYGTYFWDFNRPLFQDLTEYKDNKTNYSTYSNKGYFEYLDNIVQNGWNNWATATNGGKNLKKTTTTNNSDNNGGGQNLGDSVTSVTGSAKQIRNITVNIDSFNKGGINTQNTSLQKMDARQIEDWFIDACMKAVRNVEMSYS